MRTGNSYGESFAITSLFPRNKEDWLLRTQRAISIVNIESVIVRSIARSYRYEESGAIVY